MIKSINENGDITINGLTFLQFANEFKGFYILNKNGFRVFKYVLFWSGANPTKIKEKFTLIRRD